MALQRREKTLLFVAVTTALFWISVILWPDHPWRRLWAYPEPMDPPVVGATTYCCGQDCNP